MSETKFNNCGQTHCLKDIPIPTIDSPKDFNDYDLTDLYIKEVEKQIKNAPEHYLWTHKRFKHTGKEPI